MEGENTQAQGTGGEQQEPDYKALYEEAKANSRKWEKQAKANKEAAGELAKAQEAGKTAEEQIADLKKRLDDKERAEERRKVAAKVAREKGVPADLLVGDTAEEMEAWADGLLSHFKPKTGATVEKPGKFDRGGSGGNAKDDFSKFMNEMFS